MLFRFWCQDFFLLFSLIFFVVLEEAYVINVDFNDNSSIYDYRGKGSSVLALHGLLLVVGRGYRGSPELPFRGHWRGLMKMGGPWWSPQILGFLISGHKTPEEVADKDLQVLTLIHVQGHCDFGTVVKQ